MPWGEGPGELPPLREVNGLALVHMAAEARVHHLVGADELEVGQARDCWHQFADLMRDAADSAADLDVADRATLARSVDAAIADLKAVRARVLAGSAGQILYVAVLPRGCRRDPRLLFARS